MPESIRYILEKLKPFLANDLLFHSVLLVLVGVASFGLGRQSVGEGSIQNNLENKASVGLLVPTPTVSAPEATTSSSAQPLTTTSPVASVVVVGSKSGTKYHLPDCPGAKRIKPENLITFESIDAAKAAGYSAASNCDFK